jgi:hypothetical protein
LQLFVTQQKVLASYGSSNKLTLSKRNLWFHGPRGWKFKVKVCEG